MLTLKNRKEGMVTQKMKEKFNGNKYKYK